VQIRKLFKPVSTILELKATDPEVLAKFDAAIKALPPGESMARPLDELVAAARSLVSEARRIRSATFGRLEAAFLTRAKSAGQPVRELDTGWRVGGLEIQVNREQSIARVLVNRETIGPFGSGKTHFLRQRSCATGAPGGRGWYRRRMDRQWCRATARWAVGWRRPSSAVECSRRRSPGCQGHPQRAAVHAFIPCRDRWG